jgi:hypothetical protein
MYKNLLIISLHDILKKETLRMDFIYRMKSANNSIYFFFKKKTSLKNFVGLVDFILPILLPFSFTSKTQLDMAQYVSQTTLALAMLFWFILQYYSYIQT